MSAIKTKYAGVWFRSRLEARWAAFFDLLGWNWEYEPIDLDGWIPDFVLFGKKGNTILVECKPFLMAPYLEPDFKIVSNEKSLQKVFKVAEQLMKKSEYGNCEPEIIIVGANIIPFATECDIGTCMGFFAHGDQVMILESGGFSERWGGYQDRMTGFYDGYRPDAPASMVLPIWREAGNMVQWKSGINNLPTQTEST